ncbi:hypothetical protein [Streptomyces pseudogriseolus]|uniref:hypothetical protein n=1 Tax=Streptomyces pseudogriseolus TaxID=36817 RepID=UPI003FA1C992
MVSGHQSGDVEYSGYVAVFAVQCLGKKSSPGMPMDGAVVAWGYRSVSRCRRYCRHRRFGLGRHHRGRVGALPHDRPT